MTSELQAFAALVLKNAAAIKAEFEKSRFQMQAKAALAEKYNVSQTLFGGDSFWRECGRKQTCRELAAQTANA